MSSTKKKSFKKKSSKTELPFSTKGAPKGKVRVHIVVGVSSLADSMIYHPSDSQTMDHAVNEVTTEMDGAIEMHHYTVDLPIPKVKKGKLSKKVSKGKVDKSAEKADDFNPEWSK